MNALKWEDINFNLIKKGMITGGGQFGDQQTSVSFAEYLNVFLETAKHRYLVLDGSIPLNLTLVNFERGFIRNTDLLRPDSDAPYVPFQDQYKLLVNMVCRPLVDDVFYSPEILIDPVNYEDYELPKLSFTVDAVQAFADFLGISIETAEVLRKAALNSALAHYEVFTADVLHALYKIFTVYTIKKRSYSSNWTRAGRRWTNAPIEPDTLTRDVSKTWVGNWGKGVTTTINEANTEAYNRYSEDYRQDDYINATYPRFNSAYQLAYRRVTKRESTDGRKNVSYGSTEGHTLVWSFKNSEDEFVDVQFSMYGVLNSNYRFVYSSIRSEENNQYNEIDLGATYSAFPKVKDRLFFAEPGDDESINVNIENFKSSTQFDDDGAFVSYSFSGGYPVNKMPKNTRYQDEGLPFPTYEEDFWITSPGFVFADANSEGFDYYADPNLWP
jgi:hypothetical protein